MNEVKRYDSQYEGWNYEDETGEYVLFDDFESERVLRKEAENKLHELQDAIVALHKFNPALTPLDEKSRDLIFESIEESRKRREGK